MVGTLDVEVPLARSCGEEVLTPGGSAVILVPENIVSILAVVVGLLRDPIDSCEWTSDFDVRVGEGPQCVRRTS